MNMTNSTKPPIDVVYVLGHGSAWNNNELRYSLRSLETYLTDLGTVYIIGQRPTWLTNVRHYNFADYYGCKERNIMTKLAYACGHPDLSQTFLNVHDDYFALAPMSGHDIPNWCSGPLGPFGKAIKARKPRNHWADAVINTDRVLTKAGHTVHNFDLHYPKRFDKTLFPATMDLYDWKGTPRGFVVNSLYYNTLGMKPTLYSDLKIDNRLTFAQMVARLKGRPWFSIGNGALNLNFKELLAALYPTPSRFEIK